MLQGALELSFLAALLHPEGVRLPLGAGGRWTVRVALAEAGGLHDGSRAPVTVAGVASGKVEHVAYDPERGRAVATLSLDAAAKGVLRRDAGATVVPRSALQDLTLELAPGRDAAALGDGDWIGTAHTAAPVALDRLVGVLDTDTRVQVQVLLGQLAVGLRGHSGALRDAVQRLAHVLDPARQVTSALAARRTQLTRLVDDLARVTGALGEHDRALAEGLRAGRRTLEVTGAREAAVGATVDELAPTLASLRRALAATRDLATPLEPALTRLRPAARALPATLDALRATVPDGRTLIGTLDGLTRDGAAGLAAARGVARSLPRLTGSLTSAARDGETFVRAIDANRDGIGLLGERFSGVLSTSDANGIVLRGLGFFEPFNPEDFGEAGASGARLATLKTQAVTALVRTCRRDNALACLARYLVPGLPGSVR
ncbi:MAG: phospholipid/cholesterol/gamma-HCH transport system substrate-binding protein [Solirubrobacteraceae bacterium]|nr:phospholipid/cholesterol/gamma-HCH transport system substrate-binding protein [Solirubrobacteraceae bacterium]